MMIRIYLTPKAVELTGFDDPVKLCEVRSTRNCLLWLDGGPRYAGVGLVCDRAALDFLRQEFTRHLTEDGDMHPNARRKVCHTAIRRIDEAIRFAAGNGMLR